MSMVRVCTKCKEYVFIHETYKGHQLLENFKLTHSKHPQMTLNFNEASEYHNVTKKFAESTS